MVYECLDVYQHKAEWGEFIVDLYDTLDTTLIFEYFAQSVSTSSVA